METLRERQEEDSVSVGGNQPKTQQFEGMGRSDSSLLLPPTCHARELPTLVRSLPRTFTPPGSLCLLRADVVLLLLASLTGSICRRQNDKSTCFGTEPTWVPTPTL